MAKHTGTAKGIAVWFRQQRASAETSIELHAMPLEGPQLVAVWPANEIANDVEAWSRVVDELAASDAEARDTTTRYELRHVVDDKPRGVSHLRRVVDRTEAEETKPTGDMVSIVSQLQRSLERANAQVIESARVVTQAATAATEAQRAALVMLGQSYQLIGQLQQSNVALHARSVEASADAPPTPSEGDQAFKAMVELFAPVLLQKFLGDDTEEDEPTPKGDA